MRHIIVLILLIFMGYAVDAQNDTLLYNKSDAKGRKQGIWQKKHPNGKIRYTGQFLNDIPQGEFRYYYSSGKLNATVKHKGNGLNASTTIYNEAGDSTASGFYFRQQKDSIWKFFDSKGTLLALEFYKDGKPNGSWIVYYRSDTVIAERTDYKNGLKDGKFEQYFLNGQIKVAGSYRNGNLSGPYKSYFPDGMLLNEGQYYDGLADGVWKYYTNKGELKRKEWLRKGELIKEEIYIADEPIIDKALDPSLDPELSEGL